MASHMPTLCKIKIAFLDLFGELGGGVGSVDNLSGFVQQDKYSRAIPTNEIDFFFIKILRKKIHCSPMQIHYVWHDKGVEPFS